MNIVSTRTAPAGARFSAPSAARLATIDAMVARAAAFGGVGRMAASATNTAATEPTPAPPNTAPDTGARLDACDAELADHAARISALEERSPPPPPVDTGAQAAPPAASAATSVSTMVDGAAIYARMNARVTGLKAAAPASPAPAVIQTAAGPMLDIRAMYARLNATATARAAHGRRS